MELQFKKTTFSCLDTALREVRSCEETLELKLSDGMPDIGHITAAWGQVILRSKEWRGDSILLSGGCMVWVLYAPEDGGPERVMDGWMPFQMRFSLPPDTREGDIRVSCLLRSVDARSVSPRKIMVRAGVGAMAEAFVPAEPEVYAPDGTEEPVQMLKTAYPLRLAREAGEKTFLLDQELTLPDSAPALDQLIYFRLTPAITDKKVLGAKAVFRGNGNLHILYRSPEGQMHSWDFDLPFSQFDELRGEYSGDAQMDISPEVTALELDAADGRLSLKGGIVAQYLITDKTMLELVEDAYCPGRMVTLQREALEVPVLLDSRREAMYPQLDIPAQADQTADVQFLADFPLQRRMEGSVDMELPGAFQTLYYGEDGGLHGAAGRWTGRQTWGAGEGAEVSAVPRFAQPQAALGAGVITAKAELPVDLVTTARQSLPMVTGVELGQSLPPDPARPSLIVRRAGDARLWDIAKGSGTTVAAIKKANGLQDEPAPGQMLLIPVS